MPCVASPLSKGEWRGGARQIGRRTRPSATQVEPQLRDRASTVEAGVSRVSRLSRREALGAARAARVVGGVVRAGVMPSEPYQNLGGGRRGVAC